MTSQPVHEPHDHRGEIEPAALTAVANRLSYPPTPDISRRVGASLRVRHRPLRAWQLALISLVVLTAALLAVPQVRAFVGQYFRIGVVRILPFGPTAAPTPVSTITPRSPAASPSVTPGSLPSPLVGLEGRITLEEAHQRARFPVLLPGYPSDLGPPDYAFYQREIPMLIFAWADPGDPRQLLLSLFEIDSRSPMVSKYEPQIIEETSVNGEYALWVEGPYLVELSSQDYVHRYLVEGGTLVWEGDGVTYRLETRLPIEEAVRVAESLEVVEP